MMKKYRIFFLIFAVMMALHGVTVSAAALNYKSVTLAIGNTKQLKVTGAGKNIIKWGTTNKKIATVSTKGKVTAKAAGTVTIKAKVGKKTLSCRVTVKNPSLKITKLQVRTGATYKIGINYQGTAAVKWSTANKKIATVSAKGVVKGVKAGTVKVTALMRGKKYTCTVNVLPKLVAVQNKTTSGKVPAAPAAAPATGVITTATFNSYTTAWTALSRGVKDEAELAALQRILSLIGTTDQDFPNGYREGVIYNNSNYYRWNGGLYRGGYGCAGFAFRLSDAAFGKNLATMNPIAFYTDIGKIRIGDIIRLDYNTHSVIVIRVEADHVIVAEGNYNNSIHWGRKIYFSEIKTTGSNIMTRYVTKEMMESEDYQNAVAENAAAAAEGRLPNLK